MKDSHVFRRGVLSSLALALGACATSQAAPPKEQWFQDLFSPYTFDEQCKQHRAKSGQALVEYASRVERIDFDCILEAKPDFPPASTDRLEYILANAYLALQSHIADHRTFDVEAFVRTTRLIEHPKDRRVVYTVASLLFYRAATQPELLEKYEPCAKKMAFKAQDLGYTEAFWIIHRNEGLLSGWLPDEVHCEIPTFNTFLEKM